MAKPTFSFGNKKDSEEVVSKMEHPSYEITPETVSYTHEALGTYKDDVTGEWMLAVVKYNPVTKQAEVSETIPSGGGRDFVIEKFKIAAVNRGLVG